MPPTKASELEGGMSNVAVGEIIVRDEPISCDDTDDAISCPDVIDEAGVSIDDSCCVGKADVMMASDIVPTVAGDWSGNSLMLLVTSW
jgi:hypothetical protein